jgi:hypothetical protein
MLPETNLNLECDHCLEKSVGNQADAVMAGLHQRTCTSCHRVYLSQHNL